MFYNVNVNVLILSEFKQKMVDIKSCFSQERSRLLEQC